MLYDKITQKFQIHSIEKTIQERDYVLKSKKSWMFPLGQQICYAATAQQVLETIPKEI
jgi:hypothetical protein